MTNQAKKIMWLSPMCCLDHRGGAACQIRSVLTSLASAGWEAYAVHMTLFDGEDQYPMSTLIGKQHAVPENYGKTFNFTRDGVHQRLFYTKSSFGKNLTKEEAQTFFDRAKKILEEIQPDVVLTYGSSNLCKALIREARKNCKTLIFYLANPSYDDPELFRPFDQVLTNSNYMVEYYRDKIGIECKVLRTLLPDAYVVDPKQVLSTRSPHERDMGFITMINPSLPKGATLFARLVQIALRERPEWTFLCVEGRMTDEQWANAGMDLANQANIFWIHNQQNMQRVYARTSILLFPSFWIEAAGRVGVEAQLGGIPVLGSNHAGIPELLNGGGFLFDIPERCRERYQSIPTEAEVRPWLDTIAKLYDDWDFYREAVNRALDRGKWIHPDNIRPRVIQMFEDYAEGKNLRPPLDPNKDVKAKTHAPVVKGEKIGRNDPCPCGSGKKAKTCCGTEGPSPENRAIDIKALMSEKATREPTQEELKHELSMFEKNLGYKPNLENPKTFNEKIARRKLFGEEKDAVLLQDKWSVRQMVQDRAGADVLPEVHQVAAHSYEIDLNSLPESFRIIPNYMPGGNKLVPDKAQESIRQYCAKLLSAKYGQQTNEYWYSHIQPRVMFTETLEGSLKEYKLFVFHGKCQFIQLDDGSRRTIYDTDWQVQPVGIKLPQGPAEDKPQTLEQMIETAEKIGEGYDFMRVNIYHLDGRILFSSITLAPGAGWERFFDTNNPQGSYDMDKWFGSFW